MYSISHRVGILLICFWYYSPEHHISGHATDALYHIDSSNTYSTTTGNQPYHEINTGTSNILSIVGVTYKTDFESL
jgi:hypothetical protein